MSIFPTKILLANDGSNEAQLAGLIAVDLAQKTDSELHAMPDLQRRPVIHVVGK